MTDSDSATDEIETPLPVPAIGDEWIITLNGHITREGEYRLPDLSIYGVVTANTELDGRPAVVEVLY